MYLFCVWSGICSGLNANQIEISTLLNVQGVKNLKFPYQCDQLE